MIRRIGSPIPFVSRELFGGKGKNLLELGEEFPVPEGFVVLSDAFERTGNILVSEDLDRLVLCIDNARNQINGAINKDINDQYHDVMNKTGKMMSIAINNIGKGK